MRPELEERTASDPWFDACILPKHTLLIVSFLAIFSSFLRAPRLGRAHRGGRASRGKGPAGRRELEERSAYDQWFDACILLKHTSNMVL